MRDAQMVGSAQSASESQAPCRLEVVAPFTWRRALAGARVLGPTHLHAVVRRGPCVTWCDAVSPGVRAVFNAASEGPRGAQVLFGGYHLGRVLLGDSDVPVAGAANRRVGRRLRTAAAHLDTRGALDALGGSLRHAVEELAGKVAGSAAHPSRPGTTEALVLAYEWALGVAVLEADLAAGEQARS